jgi:transposase
MAFIQHKKIKNKTYAYEVTSYWDKDLKQTRKHSKYLGPIDPETKKIIPFIKKKNNNKEKLILDFGDGYFLYELIKKLEIYKIFNSTIFNKFTNVFPIAIYRLCTQLSMYHFENWFDGNILSCLFENIDVSSQRLSELFFSLGDEPTQRYFFSDYIKHVGGSKKSVIIDATSLPNHINIDYNEWGRSDGKVEKQFRLICVIDQINKTPLFYRLLPGNIIDVSTLQTTILELKAMGVTSSYILMDAGYFSESNLFDLFDKKINFLTRMPARIKIYKDIILNKLSNIESLKNLNVIGTRSYFVKSFRIDLYGNNAHAFVILDPERKAKELKELSYKYCNDKSERNESKDKLEFNACGIMILVSSKKIPASEILSSYYLRQSVEQVFSFSKSDLSLLPIRNHNEQTVRGYLFFQFLLLILYLKIKEQISNEYSVEQALLILRKLKCKVFDNQIIPSEPTKKQRLIFEESKIDLPKYITI